MSNPLLKPLPNEASSLQSFRDRIEQEFIVDSAIAPELYQDTIEFLSDLEVGDSGDVFAPIHEALNWKFTRFGYQVKPTLFAAIFRNEDESIWQAKLSDPRLNKKGEIQKYENPVGNGSRTYLPPVNQFARDAIAQRYGIEVPSDGPFWDWVEAHPELEIIFTEGGKKALALLSQGFIAISLYGVNGGYRTKDDQDNTVPAYLIPDVLRFAVPGRRFVLAFDQDSKEKTRIKVGKALFKFSRLLETIGCLVRVAIWAVKQGKGVDDLIVISGVEAWEVAYANALSLKEKQLWDRLDRRLTVVPNLRLTTQDLATLHISDLPDEGIVAIASPKGTGKTKFIAAQVQDTEKTILATHRVALARHLCERLDMDYRGDLDKVNGGDFIAGAGYTFRVGTCVDSLLAIDPEKFRGCDLVIDEVCQVLRHMLTSSTCNKDGKRPAILARFRELLQSARRVIVADADLDNDTLRYLKEMRRDENEIFLIRNDHASQGYPVHFIEAQDRTSICERLFKDIQTQRTGQILYVATDSKTTSKTLFGMIAQLYPDKRVLLINSDTSGGEDERDFIANPDAVLGRNEYDIILCSPSVATGTSIEIQDCIWKVYGIFQGVSGTDADIAQSLARVRQPVQRIVWCSKTGRNFCKTSLSVNPLELKGHLFERTSVSVSLTRSSLKADTATALEHIDWQTDPSIQLFSQISAAQNFAMYNLRDALYVRLKHEGNPVTIERSPSNSLLKFQLQQCREAIKLTDAMTILNAEDLSLIEIFALEQKEVAAPDEQRAIAKYHIKEFYCLDELTIQDILLDREGRTRGELLNLEAQLFDGVGLDRTVRALERQSSWRQALCPWDIPGTEMRREIRDRIGLTDFIREAATGWEWAKADLEEIAGVARRFAPAIKAHLNFTITEDMSNVQVVHQLLSQMGIKTEFRWSIHHPSSLGTKIRVYSLNMHHWDLCWSILERREQRRERISSGEDAEIAGSPAESIELNPAGDPALIEAEPHAIAQNLVSNEKSSYQQPDLPFVWRSNKEAV
jgi:Domain of unknown function (DUF3854)/Origin of replication binding protein